MTVIPTYIELYNGILSDLETQMQVSVPIFGKNFLRALAVVQAGKLWLYYKAIANVQKNIFIDTAEPESIGGTLERFGRVKLNREPFSARAGEYIVTVTGSIGAIIPAQSTFKSDDTVINSGKLFILDSAFTLVATTDSITIRALEAGNDSKLNIGDTLTATAPIALVDSIVTVSAETIEPSAEENIEDYRDKALDAYRLEPQGGAATDYRLWSADAQGVKQSYPYAKTGVVNEINLFVEATIADSIDGKGTPSALLLTDVEEVVEFDPDTTRPTYERGRRPLGVIVNFLPVTVLNVDVTINGFVGLTVDIQNAIELSLIDEINLVRPFVAACDILDEKNDILDSNKIISIILNTRPGSVFGAITLNVGGVPYNSYTFINGNIPYVNSINFV
ncbi:MAG: baseplate J/gp47 family protein [Chitinophagales bacterium]|nr:baseplate J/gp47 family protein [Chitinophagales bacterium]